LPRIRVVEVAVDLSERLEVVVRDLRSVVRCPWCGFKTSRVHETRRVKVKDVPRAPGGDAHLAQASLLLRELR
jgi:hypothetical protein